MQDQHLEVKKNYLKSMAKRLIEDAWAGEVFKRQIAIRKTNIIPGPRSGAVDLIAGADNGQLYQVLRKNDNSLARHYIPWEFQSGDVAIYNVSNRLRIEAPWSNQHSFSEIQFTPQLLEQHIPHDTARFFAGVSQLGQIVTLTLDDVTPHWLVSGSTGSGKTWIIRCIAWQLSRREDNRLVLVDAKSGEGLGACQGLPRLMGPMVTEMEIDTVVKVLHSLVVEMQTRYQLIAQGKAENSFDLRKMGYPRIIVFLDEIQELVLDKDFLKLFRKLLAQGRAAGIHFVVSTQQPTADIFKDRTIKPNLRGRIALQTTHAEASRAALGVAEPRADLLAGSGDAYCKTGDARIHRVQLGFVSPEDLKHKPQVPPPWEFLPVDSLEATLNGGASWIDVAQQIDPKFFAGLMIATKRKMNQARFLKMMGTETVDEQQLKALKSLARRVNKEAEELGYTLGK